MKIQYWIWAALVGAAAPALGHGGGPLIALDPAVNPSDLYLFRGPADDPAAKDTITFIATFWPLPPPALGAAIPRFADEARYEIKIDLDGDAREDLTYQFEFEGRFKAGEKHLLYSEGVVGSPSDDNLYYRQVARVTRLERGGKKSDQKDVVVAPPFFGPVAYPSRPGVTSEQAYEGVAEKAITQLTTKGGGRVFLGPRDDPFFGDLNAVLRPAGFRLAGTDTVAGSNVMAIALQLPLSALFGEDAPAAEHGKKSVVGAWLATSRAKSVTLRPGKGPKGSGWQQVGRAGLPLWPALLLPLSARDEFAADSPREDAHALGASLKDPELAKMMARTGVTVPGARRTDLVSLLAFDVGAAPLDVRGLTPADILRLDLSAPASKVEGAERLGFIGGDRSGFPNGRRLGDDVVDILWRVVAGALCVKDRSCDTDPSTAPLGDGVNGNDRPWGKSFPYLAPPTGPRGAAAK